MKLLIVEDDENKRNQLLNFITEEFPGFELDAARSYQSGLRKIVNTNYELILLDMTMPTFDIDIDEDGGRPQAYAGREILRQMKRRNIKTPVLIVTQFDRFGDLSSSMTLKQLTEQLRDEHPNNYLGSVYYNAASSEWREKMKEFLVNFI